MYYLIDFVINDYNIIIFYLTAFYQKIKIKIFKKIIYLKK
jgi:hypothetical protein